MARTCREYGKIHKRIVLLERPEGKPPLRRPRRRWEDNINMDLKEEGCDATNCMDLVQDRDQGQAYT